MTDELAEGPAGNIVGRATPTTSGGRLRALRHRDYRLIWLASATAQLGFWMSSIAFQWQISHLTDNDSLMLGVLYFCFFAPLLFFSLPAGALADSRDRRRIAIGAQCAVAVSAGVLATLVGLGHAGVPTLLALAFALGSAIAVNNPAVQALVANAVPAADLASAVPIQAMALNAARLSGPMLAGPVLLSWGAAGSFGIYAAAGIAAALLFWGVRPAATRPGSVAVTPVVVGARVRGTRRRGRSGAARETVRARIAGGFRHARERRPAVLTLGIVAVTSAFGSSYQSQLTVFAHNAGRGDQAFLTLAAVAGLGALVGVLFVLFRGPGAGVLFAAGALIALGGCLALMGTTRSFPVLVGCVLVVGMLAFAIMTTANSVLQRLVDDAQRGRVMSLYFLCWGGLLPLGGLLLGVLSRLTGTSVAMACYGTIVAAFGIASVFRLRTTATHNSP